MNSMGQQESPLSAPPDPWGRLNKSVSEGRGFRAKKLSPLDYPGGGGGNPRGYT